MKRTSENLHCRLRLWTHSGLILILMWLHVLLVYCQFALLFVNNKAYFGFYMVGLHDLTVHVHVYDLKKLCFSNSIWMNGVYKSGIIQSEFSCKMLLRNIKYCQIRPYHSDITNFHRIFPVWSKWNLLHMLHIYIWSVDVHIF